MKIWLDDERSAPKGWIRSYSVADTIAQIRAGAAATLRTGEEGWHVLRWLEEEVFHYDLELPVIYIHTSNPVARQRMESILKSIQRIQEQKSS